MKKVSLMKRVVAYLIDMVIVSFILYPLMGFDYLNFEFNIQVAIVAVISIFVTYLYFVLFEFYLNQTFGKIIFGIYVRSVSGKLKLSQVLIRNISKIGWELIILDTLYLYIKKIDQRYLEVLSKTMVYLK